MAGQPDWGGGGGEDEVDIDMEAGQRFNNFLALVSRLVRKRVDSQVFEDRCRDILGNSGYVLFTLDKLLERLTKKL